MKDSPITDALKDKAEEAGEALSDKYDKSGAHKIVKPAAAVARVSIRVVDKVGRTALRTGKDSVQKINEQFEITQKAKKFWMKKEITKRFLVASEKAEKMYGDTRAMIKPYFAPEDARELLENTKRQLTSITATILQIRDKEAEGWMGEFGKLVSAKVAGVAGTATLFSLVSTFGTAGTGTAIATLSGAASYNATMAAIGLGGGMATGALVLSGFGIILGMVTYKFLSSTARDYDTLPPEDKQIVDTCALLSAAIKDKLEQNPLELSADEAIQFQKALDKLHQHLKDNVERICKNLDTKNKIKYRQHILKNFEPVVLDGFRKYVTNAPFDISDIIGGVFYALLTETALDSSSQTKLVLEALRRSNNSLHDANESELSEYLHSLPPEQLRGAANNVKGIYHELKYVEEYNATNKDTYAELHISTTHQGSDVMIKSTETGEVLKEYQLKATYSESYVRYHQERYPDVEIVATDEVAERMEAKGVEASGNSNLELTNTVNTVFDNVAGNTIGDRIFEAAEISGLAKAGLEAINVLQGKTNLPDAGKKTLRATASMAAATGITSYLFGQF